MANDDAAEGGETPVAAAVATPSAEQADSDGDAPAAAPPKAAAQAQAADAEDGFRRTDVTETVTPEEAVAALNDALDLLKKANNPNMPWQDARHVLDVTGDALDMAGLALREACGDDGDGPVDENPVERFVAAAIDGGGDDDDEEDDGLGEVQWLSVMVSAARSRFLGDAYVDAKVKAPPPLPTAGTDDAPLVVWATQTGTAEKFAQSLAKRLGKSAAVTGGGGSKKKAKVAALDMKDVALKDVVVRKRVYFVVSTFGIGRPPRVAETFYASLQLYKGAAAQGGGGESNQEVGTGGDFRPLAGVEVAVAALGDSRFKDFAAFGVNLSQELQALGATPVINVTKVDGKNGPDEQKEKFEMWEDLVRRLEESRVAEKEANASSSDAAGSAKQQAGGADAACCVVS